MKYDIELVGKIGSMALIDKKSNIGDFFLNRRIIFAHTMAEPIKKEDTA